MREIRLFGHYLNLPLLLLSALDVLVIGVVFYGVLNELVHASNSMPLTALAVVAALTAFAAKAAAGLYHLQLRSSFKGILMRVLVAFVLGLPPVLLAASVLPLESGPLMSALAAGALAYGFLGLIHAGFFALADAGMLRRRVLVLGAGESATALSRLRRRSDRRGFELIGFVPMEELHSAAVPLLRPDRALCRFAGEHDVDEIVVALEERRNVLPIAELVECRFRRIEVTDLASFVEREAGKIRLDLLRPGWLVFEGNIGGRAQDRMKRAVDIAVSLVLLVVTFPLLVLTAMAIVREDGWNAPWLYRQSRVGKDGKIFELLKFRSMRVDAEADGQARWASKDDDRVTRVGAWIRKMRIDELPQLYNVLRGEMSMVGPRPERPEFVSELEQRIPFYGERHRVKPGISGWAQVMFPYAASHDDAAEKLEYDLYYLKNRSLLLDAIVLLQTVEVVLFSKGAR